MSTPMRHRPYVHDDLPRLQALIAQWIHAAGPCGYCHPGELAHRVYAEASGQLPPGERVQIWEDGGAIAGFALTLRFGAAFDLFTAPAQRGSPAEGAMLAEAAASTSSLMAAAAGAEEWVLSDIHACDVVRQAQLERLGFARYRVWDWLTELDLAAPIPAPELPAGFTLRPATLSDAAELAAARNETFGASWTGAGYRDEVMLRPGYDPARELVVASPDGQVAALAVLWPDALNAVGQIEPVGTRPAFRRLGLGRAVVCAALHELWRHGMARALIRHDATNLPALELYRGLGFVRRDETLGYRLPRVLEARRDAID